MPHRAHKHITAGACVQTPHVHEAHTHSCFLALSCAPRNTRAIPITKGYRVCTHTLGSCFHSEYSMHRGECTRTHTHVCTLGSDGDLGLAYHRAKLSDGGGAKLGSWHQCRFCYPSAIWGGKRTPLFPHTRPAPCRMLRSNMISCVNNDTFAGLSSVRLLSLYDNRITTITPGAFTTLVSLSTM